MNEYNLKANSLANILIILCKLAWWHINGRNIRLYQLYYQYEWILATVHNNNLKIQKDTWIIPRKKNWFINLETKNSNGTKCSKMLSKIYTARIKRNTQNIQIELNFTGCNKMLAKFASVSHDAAWHEPMRTNFTEIVQLRTWMLLFATIKKFYRKTLKEKSLSLTLCYIIIPFKDSI